MNDLRLKLKRKHVEFDEVCDKKAHQQKFEKIILLPVLETYNYFRHRTIANVSVETEKLLTKHDEPGTSNNENLSSYDQTANRTIINSANVYLPYQTLLAGYILGIASGMLICYIWLSGKCSINWRCRRRQQFDNMLLFDWYYSDYMDADTNRNIIESDPHTPPPRYSEVMLQPSLYCPRIPSNLNNNSTAYL